ncbi:MAG: hypothetical protein WKF34_11350 [Pyrinomonadaceae bacterium]
MTRRERDFEFVTTSGETNANAERLSLFAYRLAAFLRLAVDPEYHALAISTNLRIPVYIPIMPNSSRVLISRFLCLRFLLVVLVLTAIAGVTLVAGSGESSFDSVRGVFGYTAEAAPFATLHGDAAVTELKRQGLYESLADAVRSTHYGSQDILAPDAVAQQAYLKASNTGADDQFGDSVAVSGDTVVVGAIFEASNAIGVNGDQTINLAAGSGAAYVFTRSGTTWSQQAYLKASNTGVGDQFGFSVAISGDTVVVGARFEDSNAIGVNGDQTNNSAVDSGAAYVFTRIGTAWSQQAYLKASNTGVGDQFGFSVAISGDTVVVGADSEDSNATGVDGNQTNNSANLAGAAYVFTRSGTAWSQQAYLKASNTGAIDFFGESVAVSGDTVAVGAPVEASNATGVNGDQTNNSAIDSGAAYVFIRSGTVWSQQAYLKASNTGADDFFGISVAVSRDTVVVGAVNEDSSATGVNGDQTNNSAGGSGAAYVFTRIGDTWSQQAYLKASNTGAIDSFGVSVAVSGDTVVVGAVSEDSNATGVNGDQTSNSAFESGAAYVFTRSGTAWSQQAYLKASNTGANDDFGDVAISGDTVVVGAAREDSNATGVNGDQTNNSASASGAAYVFTSASPTQTFTVSGKVTTPGGLGLRNAVVALTDSQGLRRTALTSSFGFYTFENVVGGNTYTVSVSSRRYRFAARSVTVNESLSNVDFVGLE